MRKTIAGLVVGLAVAGGSLVALAQDDSPEGHRGHGRMQARLLEKYDANKNGVLDPEEKEAAKADRAKFRAERHQKMLEKFDANHNGTIDPEERQAIRAEHQARRQEMLKKYDTDGDGKLSPSEREQLRKDMREKHHEDATK